MKRCSASRRAQFELVCIAVMGMACVTPHAMATSAVGAPPPVIDSIDPGEVIEKPVPQPAFKVFGQNLRQPGVFDASGNPTITIEHTELKGVSFSAVASTNFAGTEATIPAGLNHFNMLQMPLGVYDVNLTRPDGTAALVARGFSLVEEPELDLEPGEIKMTIASHWGGPVTGADVHGDYAYLANGRRLVIVDISDESNPIEVGSLYLNHTFDVKVRDGYAFVATHGDGHGSLSVVDVADPSSPELVWNGGGHVGGGARRDLLVYEDYVYLSGNTGGNIRAFDITDPLNTIHLGVVGITGHNTFAILGDYLVTGRGPTAGNPTMLKIYDLAADPFNPPLLSELEVDSNLFGQGVWSLTGTGDHLYAGVNVLGTFEYRLVSVDISDAANPAITDVKDHLWHLRVTNRMTTANGRLYVADEHFHGLGMQIFDIASDPAHPVIVATHKPHGSEVYGILHGTADRVYLWDVVDGFVIKDVSDPKQLLRIGHYHTPTYPQHMAKLGDTLFVTDLYGGFHVLDVSDPTSPHVVTTYKRQPYQNYFARINGFALEGNLAYLSVDRKGMEIVDVSDQANPQFLVAFRPPMDNGCSSFNGLAVNNGLAHLSYREIPFCGTDVVHYFLTVDVSDYENIAVVNQYSHLSYFGFDVAALSDQDVAFLGRDSNNSERYIGDIASASPSLVATVSGAFTKGIAWSKDILLVAKGGFEGIHRGLFIRDVSDPANPVLLAHIDSDWPLEINGHLSRAFAVDVQKSRAYVVGESGSLGTRLFVFEISAPMEPTALDAARRVGSSSSHIHVDEPSVYVANTSTSYGMNNPHGLSILTVHGIEPECPLADLNCDGVVDGSDLLILLSQWRQCDAPGDCSGDLNNDGVVDGADLLILLSNWGT